MKRCNKVLAGVALSVMVASGGAMAAVNANSIHLALTSLRLALVKIGVANAMLSSATPPSSNVEAHVAAANKLGSNEIRAILVSQGGVINIYLTPVVGLTDGIIQLVPSIVTDEQGKKAVTYDCYSPNITDIAAAAPGCTYRPAGS